MEFLPTMYEALGSPQYYKSNNVKYATTDAVESCKYKKPFLFHCIKAVLLKIAMSIVALLAKEFLPRSPVFGNQRLAVQAVWLYIY